MATSVDIRRERILRSIEETGYRRLAELSDSFAVAPVTIHRDLDYLERAGMIERVRGGARSVLISADQPPNEYSTRMMQAVVQKRQIAQRAVEEVPAGATIFLDSSTTCLALAKELAKLPNRGISVVTNSPAILESVDAPYIHVIAVPGALNQTLRAITGRWTEEFLAEINLTKAFVSAAAISLHEGLMTTQRGLADVARAITARASETVALVDSMKFGRRALLSMGPLSDVDLIITDDGLPREIAQVYTDAGLKLEFAGKAID